MGVVLFNRDYSTIYKTQTITMKPANIYKSRLIDPYKNEGKKSALGFCKKRSGIYIIYDDNGIVRYVGYSGGQLEKTCLRHFQEWNDKTQVRVTYERKDGFKVRIVLCNTARQAEALERALIIKYRPKDNPVRLQGEKADKEVYDFFEKFEHEKTLNYAEMEDAPF